MNRQNCIQCDLLLPELEAQVDKYRAIATRLEEEIHSIETRAQELEDKKPMILVDSLVGEVVPIMDYVRLQLASAKARVTLQTKIDMLERRSK